MVLSLFGANNFSNDSEIKKKFWVHQEGGILKGPVALVPPCQLLRSFGGSVALSEEITELKSG